MNDEKNLKVRSQILRLLRQKAKYLSPGRGHDFAALVWVALRGLTQRVVVYVPLIMCIVWCVDAVGAFEVPALRRVVDTGWPVLTALLTAVMIPNASWLIEISVWLLLLLAVSAILYRTHNIRAADVTRLN